MSQLTTGNIIDAMFLILRNNSAEVKKLVSDILTICAAERSKSNGMTDEHTDLYINILKQIYDSNVMLRDQAAVDTLLLKLRNNEIVIKDPDVYTSLKHIFTDETPMDDTLYRYYYKKLLNCIVLHKDITHIKRAYGAIRQFDMTNDVSQQEKLMQVISDSCSNVVNEHMSALREDEEQHTARTAVFSDANSLLKAMKVYKETSVLNKFKMGLQGLNRAMNGGLRLGEALRNSMPVKTPTGWIPIGDLKVGDVILSDDGTATTVNHVFPQGKRQMYRLTLENGSWVDADINHLWLVFVKNQLTGHFEHRVFSTRRLLYLIQKESVWVPVVWPSTSDPSFFIITSITKLEGDIDYATCISVDNPSSLFITKNNIVTHNCVVFNSLSHNGKSLILLKIARWIVTLNRVDATYKNPVCLFYSLENETPQNVRQLYEELWINEYHTLPPPDVTDEQIVQYAISAVKKYGWELIIQRRVGSEFGFPELVAEFENYKRIGYTPMAVIIDYVNMMKKEGNVESIGNHNQIKQIYTNLCNFLKSHNCCFITAHQLNRKAAEVVRLNPVGAVKKFDMSMLADSTDPQREVDMVFYQHKEQDNKGRSWLTFKIDKHRYDTTTPEKNKYFAYMFDGPVGIEDDINGEDKSTDNIYAAKKKKDDNDDNEFDF